MNVSIENLRLLSEIWQEAINSARLRNRRRVDEISQQLERMEDARKKLGLEIVMGRVPLSRGIDLDLEAEAVRMEMGVLRLGLDQLQHEQGRWRNMAVSLRQLGEAVQSEMEAHNATGRDPDQIAKDIDFCQGRIQHLLKMTTERMGMWPGLQSALSELEGEAA
ncbi:MAG: hypothetical protein AB7W37_18085 [Syntrophobacteraceae bacterium]